jgi:hypothetical protein
MIGAQKNCMPAYANAIQPPQRAASLIVPPVRWVMSLGMTGMMMPRPATSMSNVTRMNHKAGARDDFMRGRLSVRQMDSAAV